jgi:hypothetical protein
MCSECISPAWHAPRATYCADDFYVTGAPCPAWPRWANGVAAVREAVRQVRQGRGHRWEIWSALSRPEPPGH